MTNIPQQVTVRYVHHLLLRGINNEFEILTVARQVSIVDEVCVGVYYNVIVKHATETLGGTNVSAAGATPVQALERALVKFGVTFR